MDGLGRHSDLPPPLNFASTLTRHTAIALPAEDSEGRLAAEVGAEVQRQEVARCRQWLAQGKRGGMSHSESV